MSNFKAGDKVRFEPKELTREDIDQLYNDEIADNVDYTVDIIDLRGIKLIDHDYFHHSRHFTHAT